MDRLMKPYLLMLVILATVACKPDESYEPYAYNQNPTYTWGWADFYGADYSHYQNKNNVISLSLFSDSLRIDSLGNLEGTGQYLFLEDVFVSSTDTLLRDGTYTVSKTRVPFTIYPGENDTVDTQIFPIGARISYFEKLPSKSVAKQITEGTMSVSRLAKGVYVEFNFKTNDKKVLKGSFVGAIPHFDNSIKKIRKVLYPTLFIR